jgi:hypothetical protein
MRRAILGLAIVFAAAFAVGVSSQRVEAKGFGPCTYRCICSVPHRCCTVNGVTTCKPDPNGPLQCPQVQEC